MSCNSATRNRCQCENALHWFMSLNQLGLIKNRNLWLDAILITLSMCFFFQCKELMMLECIDVWTTRFEIIETRKKTRLII